MSNCNIVKIYNYQTTNYYRAKKNIHGVFHSKFRPVGASTLSKRRTKGQQTTASIIAVFGPTPGIVAPSVSYLKAWCLIDPLIFQQQQSTSDFFLVCSLYLFCMICLQNQEVTPRLVPHGAEAIAIKVRNLQFSFFLPCLKQLYTHSIDIRSFFISGAQYRT